MAGDRLDIEISIRRGQILELEQKLEQMRHELDVLEKAARLRPSTSTPLRAEDLTPEERTHFRQLTVSQLANPPSASTTRWRAPMSEAMQRVIDDLPALFEEFSDAGIRVEHIRARYNLTYNDATTILRQIGAKGLGTWGYIGLSRSKSLRPRAGKIEKVDLIDAAEEMLPLPLTNNQSAVFAVIARRANANRIAEISYNDIIRDAGLEISPGSVENIVHGLIRKGHILLARPSHGKDPAQYQILKELEEEA